MTLRLGPKEPIIPNLVNSPEKQFLGPREHCLRSEIRYLLINSPRYLRAKYLFLSPLVLSEREETKIRYFAPETTLGRHL